MMKKRLQAISTIFAAGAFCLALPGCSVFARQTERSNLKGE